MIMRGGTRGMRVWEMYKRDERYKGYKRYNSWL